MNIEKLLAVQLVNYINSNKENISLPCYVSLGAPNRISGMNMWIQLLGGVAVKKYLRGKIKGDFNFAVYFRMSASDTGGFEAMLLVPHETLAEHFDSLKEMPVFEKYTISDISMVKQPTIFSRSADGEITYQSLWTMEYHN